MFDLRDIDPENIGLPVRFHFAILVKKSVAIGAKLNTKETLLVVHQHPFFCLPHQIIDPLASLFFFFLPFFPGRLCLYERGCYCQEQDTQAYFLHEWHCLF